MENQFFLTLIKLRTYPSNEELSIMFNLSVHTVGNVVVTWINFMYLQWKEIDTWPGQDLVQQFIPTDFGQKFPKTRIILDGVEFPIQKPRNPEAQQATFSTYKNRNTLKAVIGASPGGLITHVTECYGGSVSDRALVERSNLTIGSVILGIISWWIKASMSRTYLPHMTFRSTFQPFCKNATNSHQSLALKIRR